MTSIATIAAIIKIIGLAASAVNCACSAGNIFMMLPTAPISLPIPSVSGARAATTSIAFNAKDCCATDKPLNHSASRCNFGIKFVCIFSASRCISGARAVPICKPTFLIDSFSKKNVSSSVASAATCSFDK